MTEQNAAPPRPCLIDRKEVERRTSYSSTTIWRLVKAKKFPAPVSLPGKAAWVEAEIDAWIAARIAERNAA